MVAFVIYGGNMFNRFSRIASTLFHLLVLFVLGLFSEVKIYDAPDQVGWLGYISAPFFGCVAFITYDGKMVFAW